jgi:hypothetical protein
MKIINSTSTAGLLVLLGLLISCSPSKIESSSAGAAVNFGGGTPTTIQVTLTSSAIANSGTANVTATVTDASSNVVPNVTVSFSVISSTAGSFNPNTAVTNSSGQATSIFTAGAAVNATATIQAAVTVGSNTVSGTAQITIGSPPIIPTSIVVSLSSSTAPATGGNITVTAHVADALGPLSGATVSFAVSNPSAGSFSATTAMSNASGNATVTFTANSGNTSVNIVASSGTLNNSATLQIGTPPPPTPTSMTITVNPLSISITSQATVNVTVLSSTGQPVPNNAVTLTITSGASLASFSTGTTINITTNTSGVASTTISSGVSSGAVTVQATSGSLSPVSASFFITSDPASITLNVVNSNLINGQTTNITANVKNVLNNPVSDGTPVNFAITSLPPFAGALSAAAASTVNGVASVSFTADPSITGGVIIEASAGTLSPVQTIIIVNAAQAGTLQFVSATPQVINIQGAGASDSVVIFLVTSSAGAPLANQSVNFQLSGPTGATLDTGGGTSSSGSTDSSGQVTTIVHAGTVAGPVRIIASTAVAGPPASTLYASSGAISIGGGVPSYKWFSLSVDRFNLDGLNCDNVTSTVSVNMADRFGNYNILKGTSVSFSTPFGAIDTSNITNEAGQTTSIFRSQDPRPADGRVRILVQTTGEENFTDLNANGVYDLGTDAFSLATDDLPEPYLDANANGTHDVGELFYDWPASVQGAAAGVYNVGNGVWDASIPIWKTIDVWLTGPPAAGPTTSHIECINPGTGLYTTGDITIPKAASTVCAVYGSDQNGNALIKGTAISMTASDTADTNITVLSGYATYIDHPVNGPEITLYTVTNKNASTTDDATTSLSALINWPGKCGTAQLTVSYGGLITLGH